LIITPISNILQLSWTGIRLQTVIRVDKKAVLGLASGRKLR
jgi:hypothetical protein